MVMPAEGSSLTKAQVDCACNLKQFPGARPNTAINRFGYKMDKWHYGSHEKWAPEFGYEKDRKPLLAHVLVGRTDRHIYYLADGTDRTIILMKGQTPLDYGIRPGVTNVVPLAAAWRPHAWEFGALCA